MIIPSIDLQSGHAVQLIGGKELVIGGEDPFRWAETFKLASETAVIDLDEAMGTGSNEALVLRLASQYRCRVGGGVRNVEKAIRLLDAGARKVIIGTKASPEFLSQLPKDRVIAAVDARQGEVVVEGWQTGSGVSLEAKIAKLKPYVSGFLVTLVETEGSLKGIDIDRCKQIKALCGSTELTMAGGVMSTEEIAELDAAGIDVQVGMALYTGRFSYVDAFLAPLAAKLPEPWPTVVCDERGIALGLVWSTRDSVTAAFARQQGIYFSRSRQKLWVKGETSGATQELLRVDLDCDSDCLRFTVRQAGAGFCHKERYTCWSPYTGFKALEETLATRKREPVAGSYTNRLLTEPGLLEAKILEEAKELTQATEKEHIAQEAADVLYFTTTLLTKHGLTMADAERILDARALKVTRRKGDRKDAN